MRCTCPQDAQGPHHHRFGGSFACKDPQPCPGCGNVKPVEFLPPPPLPESDEPGDD